MNVLVCVKQVPDTTEIRIDPVKNTLIREGVPSIVNPFDGYALEAAARLKDRNPNTTIYVMSMGPEQAKAALKECLAIAADKAFLVSGRSFGGSDTLATSYILSEAVKKLEEKEQIRFDAIFCGKQAIDGDTGQVGPELAEHLNRGQVTYALETEEREESLLVLREGQDANERIEVTLPCVVTFTKPSFEPRYPTIRRKLAANRAEITVLTPEDFPEMNAEMIGLKGSPTHVKRTFVPQKKKNGIVIREDSAEVASEKLLKLLGDERLV
ncbi:MAG: electron transfer flavoprotein subunit beta/FixA family protein [Ndongobacter sp.]|nr:electron transfer flavoprotein subunit beta/FixA family protein [Ndongobacter sp.]